MKKYIRKKSDVQCENCNTTFKKDISEIKRNIEKGRKNYCSLNCLGKSNNSHLRKFDGNNSNNLKANNRRDEFTIFRSHLRRAKSRDENCNLTLDYLKDVWDKQLGKCIYSKVDLLEINYKAANDPIYTMSLDRIDSSNGYKTGNIQFISVSMNYLKNSMSHVQMLKVINIIKGEKG